jgi:hypothetical protein
VVQSDLGLDGAAGDEVEGENDGRGRGRGRGHAEEEASLLFPLPPGAAAGTVVGLIRASRLSIGPDEKLEAR